MTIIDLLRSPWAIMPDRLAEIQSIYAARVRGDELDIAAIEVRLGRPLANEQQKYEVRDGGIAVLNIRGAISPRANMFTQISGGTSADLTVKQLESMAADPRVRGCVVAWDSPGGNVQGIPALGKAVRALADAKPTVSVCEGTMASAAYWAGSGANAVYASGETDTLGSIGVVATHTYDPKRTAAQTTEVVAGKYKRIVSDNAPLTKEGRAYMQAQVDEIYSVFVEAVAENRGVSTDAVLEKMADGRVFIGRQALAAGLVDGIATVDEIAAQMAADPNQFASRRVAEFGGTGRAKKAARTMPAVAHAGPVLPQASTTTPAENLTMTPQELAAKFAAESPEAYAAVLAAGATAERERIQAVRAQSLPGHDALIEKLAMDGKTTGPEAAVAVLAAERAKTSAMAAARAADAPAPVPVVASEVDDKRGEKQPARAINPTQVYAAINRRAAVK